MKVVLFCGGLGTRLREHSDTIPKPLVPIGPRPILLHLMRYYAHYGHKEFVICLGYRGDMIREYFLEYNPFLTDDVVIGPNGRRMGSEGSDISDWTITLIDTGLHANIGERLAAVRQYVDGEEYFLANYSDQLSNLDLIAYHEAFYASNATAGFLSIRPPQSYHYVQTNGGGFVDKLVSAQQYDHWINGGFFIFHRSIFDYMEPGEELVEEPFARLAGEQKLWTTKYEGFWQSMDTFKDKIGFDRMWGRGELPWKVWD
jgi:glucose-1-phosphate cytidylyltransferase